MDAFSVRLGTILGQSESFATGSIGLVSVAFLSVSLHASPVSQIGPPSSAGYVGPRSVGTHSEEHISLQNVCCPQMGFPQTVAGDVSQLP